MTDFGRRLEAALESYDANARDAPADPLLMLLFIVRAANAQDSAPAPVMESPSTKPVSDMSGAGAAVDLPKVLARLRAGLDFGDTQFEMGRETVRALLSNIESLERDAARYRWLRDTPIWPNSILPRHIGQTWDDLIDAARKEAK